jgi:hypothetical protein
MKAWRTLSILVLAALCSAAPSAGVPTPQRPGHAEADPLTPPDTEVLVHVNVRQLLDTPVVKKHALNPFKMLVQQREELQQTLAIAGIDPFRDVATITLSLSGNLIGKAEVLSIVRGNFDPVKVQLASEAYARKYPGRLKALRGEGPPLYEIALDGKPLFAALAGKDILVVSTSKEHTLAAVRRAGQRAEAINPALQSALDRLTGADSVWMAMVVTAQLKEAMKGDEGVKSFADAMQCVTGRLELADDALMTFDIHASNPQAATQIKAKLDEVTPLLGFLGAGKDQGARVVKEVIGNIKIATEKNDVSIRLLLTNTQLEKAGKKEP